MGLLNRTLTALALSVCAATAVVSYAGEAAAQPTSGADRETARTRMEQGEAARERGDLRAALRAFEEADAIMRVPSTGLEVARTQIMLNMLLEAKETLGRVKAIPSRPGEPAAFTSARKTASDLAADVDKRTPTLTVTLKNVDPATTPRVSVDGENVPAASLEAPRKLNPGTHVVLVSAGNVEKREEVKLESGQPRTVTIDLAGGTPSAGGARREERTGDGEGKKDEKTGGGGGGSKALVYGGFGLAIVGVGVGAVTGIMSFSKVSDVKGKCGGTTCPPQYAADVDSAKDLGTLSTIAFVAGGIGAAVGVVGLLLPSGSSEEKPRPSDARTPLREVRPVVGASFVGLSGRF